MHRAVSPSDGARLACKLQIPGHAVGGRSRFGATAVAAGNPPCALSAAIDTSVRSPRKSARGCAKSSTTRRERQKHAALYRADARRRRYRGACRAAWLELSTGRAADARLARRQARCSPTGTHPLEVRNELARAMFTAWWFPFSRASASSTAIRILGNYTVFERDGEVAGHQPARLSAASGFFPPKFVRGVVDLHSRLVAWR